MKQNIFVKIDGLGFRNPALGAILEDTVDDENFESIWENLTILRFNDVFTDRGLLVEHINSACKRYNVQANISIIDEEQVEALY